MLCQHLDPTRGIFGYAQRFVVDAPMAVLATSTQAPGGASVAAFERTPLSGEALGALLVELQDGTRFAVGSGLSDAERGAPPPVGSIITFRYQELSDGGVPRFPTYVGVRHDVAWKPGSAPGKPVARPAAAKPGSRRK